MHFANSLELPALHSLLVCTATVRMALGGTVSGFPLVQGFLRVLLNQSTCQVMGAQVGMLFEAETSGNIYA